MIVDGLPDFLGLALGAGIEAADHALQFGELLHQFRGQIALRQAAPARWACSSPPSSFD